MHLLAPAKINLQLRVGAARNGYHELVTWMCTIGLWDRLSLHAVSRPGVSMTCDDAALPCDRGNLVLRAAEALQQHVGGQHLTDGWLIELKKRIPPRAGLGGGSSDAAATLIGLNRAWNLGLDLATLSAIGASLGSDVPFFLHGSSAICTGRGEQVRVLPANAPALARSRFALVILPPFGLETSKVYARFDELGRPSNNERPIDEPDWQGLNRLPAPQLMENLVNDLEPAAFSLTPPLRSLQDFAAKQLGRAVRMSGSGSSLFTLFDGRDEAANAADRLAKALQISALVADVGVPISTTVMEEA